MADFVIPKGKAYSFNIYVKDDTSVIPKDLSNMTAATFEVVAANDSCTMFTITLTVVDALNGVLTGTISSVQSSELAIERGSKADGYYLKPLYQALIHVTFSDAADISVLLEDVYVHPEGVICP